MTKEFWISLPVEDIRRSKEFFGKLGFEFNTQHGNTDHSACLLIGKKKAVVMLFEASVFKGFIDDDVAVAGQASEVLLSFDAESKTEVDEMAEKAIAAGGKSSHQPKEMQGWMYGCIFADPDGHRWNVLYMDTAKMPAGRSV